MNALQPLEITEARLGAPRQRGFGGNPGWGLRKSPRKKPAVAPASAPPNSLVMNLARKRGLTPERAYQTLRKRCLSLRVRTAIVLVGPLFPKSVELLNDLVREVANATSLEEVRVETLYYKDCWVSAKSGIAGQLFSFSIRRVMNLAGVYLEEAAEDPFHKEEIDENRGAGA